MKKFILSALFSALYLLYSVLLPPFSLPVTADATPDVYACILNDNSYLYASSNERSGLFILPKTYYVKALEIGEPFTKVEYGANGEYSEKLTGYCKTSELTFVDYIPKTPYFQSTFDVKYTIEDSDKNYPFLTEITVTCGYFGEYPIGSETYCYVYRGDSFGYVPLPSGFSVPENTEYTDRKQEDTPTEQAPEKPIEEETLPPTQIATIILLCLLAPILATLILRPTRKPNPYEED